MKKLFKIVRRVLILALLLGLAAVAALVWTDRLCQRAADGRIFRSPTAVPANDVALVLGTSKLMANGRTNLHFTQRITAAAKLYNAGKVRHLLVSGDNHIASYDEPTDMREALMAAGVPESAITCDYAGFRTLDSVMRANSVFGLHQFTIVTEEFHCPRAVWIARQRGLEAIAFAAPDLQSKRWTWRGKAREIAARAWCAVDLYVLHRQPKFPGPREPIVLTSSNP